MQIDLSRLPLRHLLPVLFLGLAAIPAAAIGVLVTKHAWDRELNSVHEQHLQIARNLAGALTRYGMDVVAVFQLAVANIPVADELPELAVLLRRLHFKHVCLLRPDGTVERIVSTVPGLAIPRIGRPVLDALALGGGGGPVKLTGVMHDRQREPTIFIGQRLPDGRAVVGALQTSYFAELQRGVQFGKQGHAAIVDHRGRVLAHPDPAWGGAIKDISGIEPVRRMVSGETGVLEFFSPATGTDMIAGYTVAPGLGWGVMIPQPVSELAERVAMVERSVWAVVGLALLVAAVLGWIVSRWVTAPLQRIGGAAERFAGGDLSARVSERGTHLTQEAASLGRRFNQLADAVTEATHAFRRSEDRFRDFATIAADWLWETDLEQIYTYVSPPSESGPGWEGGGLVGQPRAAGIRSDAEAVTAEIQAFMDRLEPFQDIRYIMQDESGEGLHVAVSGQPVRNASGEVTGYRGVARDITESVRAEARLREAELDEQRRQAQKMEAIGTLAGGIAHDFNNILGVILGYAELTVHRRRGDALVCEYLNHVLRAGERAKRLVQQILTFSRKGEQEYRALGLNKVVEDTLPLIRASLPATIEIKKRLCADFLDTVFGDATQMQQVLVNLASNAEHAMRARGGVLEVAVEPVAAVGDGSPGEVRLLVRDTGQGMAPDVVERIFEPFFSTKDVSEGTGMGLAVVHGIVTAHGGRIEVESRPGEGTTFEVYVPLHSVLPETQAAVKPGPAPAGRGRVLFVDDELSLVRLAEATLTELGYEAVATPSSLEALERFRAEPEAFDVVILDQTMPYLTGSELVVELRAIRPDVPIVLCTGFSHRIDQEAADALGVDAFCYKPLEARHLEMIINQVLEQHRPRAAAG